MNCSEECTEHKSVHNEQERLKEEMVKLENEDKDQWRALSERPKTRVLLTLLGVFIGIIITALSTSWAITSDKIEDEKDARLKLERQNERAHERLEKKFDEVKEAMNDMQIELIKEIQKIGN